MSRLPGDSDVKESNGKRQNSIDKNKKLGILELSDISGRILIFASHDFLLKNTPSQVRHLKSDETDDQVEKHAKIWKRIELQKWIWKAALLQFFLLKF